MNRIGKRTMIFKNLPRIVGNYSIVGPKEGQGNFGKYFDEVLEDDTLGEKTYEKAECKLLEAELVVVIIGLHDEVVAGACHVERSLFIEQCNFKSVAVFFELDAFDIILAAAVVILDNSAHIVIDNDSCFVFFFDVRNRLVVFVDYPVSYPDAFDIACSCSCGSCCGRCGSCSLSCRG